MSRAGRSRPPDRAGILAHIRARRFDTFLFALTLLVSAALLFSVQPVIGKLLLPRLGGTPAVWNTCMLFFQACLLAGYGYAHLLATRLSTRGQAAVHLALLAAALVTLPIRFTRVGDPPAAANPVPWLLVALATSAGPAFFVVSGTAPLLQRWFATRGRDPYFLYAASNAGSLAALLAYPLWVEPRLRLAEQTRAWTGGYIALVVLTALCALRMRRSPVPSTQSSRTPDDDAALPSVDRAAVAPPAPPPAPSRQQRLRWIGLAFVPSSYLLGVTTFLSTDIAAVPLLWVVPLALYLLTFILVFAARPPLPHALVVRLLPPAVLAAVMLMMARASQPVWLVLGVHLLAFFVAAMACHGELARLRPPPARLTDFYLMLALGGALGGAFNAVVAPWIFNRALEYPIAIALACLFVRRRQPSHGSDAGDARGESDDTDDEPGPGASQVQRVLDVVLPVILCGFAFAVVAMIPARTVREALPLMTIFLAVPVLLCWTFAARPRRFALGVAALLVPATLLPPAQAQLLDVRRSFFGVHRTLRVRADDANHFNQLFHGTTMHGAQRVDPATRRPAEPDRPTSYYHERSPFAAVFAHVAATKPNPRVGVAGLGGGSLAGFARAGWDVTFFEIDPVVQWAAERSGHFTFVGAARARGARVETILGDARLTIARQPDGHFDLLALDAFSGDAVPVHLLTREAVAMYLAKLRGDGMLVVHISNLYLDLRPAVAALAADAGCAAIIRGDIDPPPDEQRRGACGSRVVVLARSPQALAALAQDARWRPLVSGSGVASVRLPRPWTDDFSNLLETVRWTRPPG